MKGDLNNRLIPDIATRTAMLLTVLPPGVGVSPPVLLHSQSSLGVFLEIFTVLEGV